MIGKEQLEKLAKSARIEVADSEVDRLLELINKGLEDIDAIGEIDVEGLEPMHNPYDMVLRQYDDEVTDGNVAEKLMDCAPKPLYNYYAVPKILGGTDGEE